MASSILRAWNHIREYGFRSTACAGRNIFLKQTFRFWETMGIHITPSHYHQPIPDARDLSTRKKSVWKDSEMIGIDMNDENQLRFLKEVFSKYREEYVNFPKDKGQRDSEFDFYFGNGAFEAVDAEVLYCMVRYFKPSRIMEIGSGFSTLLFIKAIEANRRQERKESSFIAVDPHPSKVIKSDISGLTKLIPKEVQELDLDFFQQLESGDILFIDSSHVVKIGGDVNYLYLDVLPRIKEGVIIHAHDIFLPSEYPERWVLSEHRFWTEQYLLQAFLTYSPAFEVLWGGSYMATNYPEELKATFPSYNEGITQPGSFWMRKRFVQV
jgi:predicted O-methyltransferase YrrM